MKGEKFIPSLDAEISPQQWKNFFESPCWRDLMNTVNVRLIITRDELEQVSGEEAIMARGGAKELRFVLNLEEIIMDELKPKPQKEEQKDG